MNTNHNPAATDKLYEELVTNMTLCARYLRHNRNRFAAQDRTIELIAANGGSMPQKAIQDELGVRAASVSELISKLENRSLVVKSRRIEDKRGYDITLTEKGRQAYRRIAETTDDYSELFPSLSLEEARTLNTLLDKLSRDWTKRNPSILVAHHDHEFDLEHQRKSEV